MKKELNKKSNQVTVLLQGSYNVDSEVLRNLLEKSIVLFFIVQTIRELSYLSGFLMRMRKQEH